MLTESVLKRLTVIRSLFNMAVEQSRKPEPMCGTSILTFHDSVELFLQLASEYLDIGNQKIEFMEYWSLLEPKLPSGGLSQKESMRRLNKARVSLKHHGTLPSTLDIETFRANTNSFFMENTSLVFGIEFSSISMAFMVQSSDARSNLELADQQIKESKFETAMQNIALAFEQVIDGYEKDISPSLVDAPSLRETALEKSLWKGDKDIDDGKTKNLLEKIMDSVNSSQLAINMIILRIDYRRYLQFKLLTPIVHRFMSGRIEFFRSRDINISLEDCRFCFEFVVDTAIKTQNFCTEPGLMASSKYWEAVAKTLPANQKGDGS